MLRRFTIVEQIDWIYINALTESDWFEDEFECMDELEAVSTGERFSCADGLLIGQPVAHRYGSGYLIEDLRDVE